jgi:hypothetical protein
MIRHIVCWTLKEENKAANAAEIKQRLEMLRGQIPGLLHLEVGINAKDTPPDNWDVALLCDFESLAALNAYQEHPIHKEAAVFIASVRTNRVCVDYEVD